MCKQSALCVQEYVRTCFYWLIGASRKCHRKFSKVPLNRKLRGGQSSRQQTSMRSFTAHCFKVRRCRLSQLFWRLTISHAQLWCLHVLEGCILWTWNWFRPKIYTKFFIIFAANVKYTGSLWNQQRQQKALPARHHKTSNPNFRAYYARYHRINKTCHVV